VSELEKRNEPNGEPEGAEKSSAHIRMRLPGFVTQEEVGLGDVIKKATSAIGVRPCGGCERRAVALNRWLTFSGRRVR
jgi:hypothetical protein